MFCHQVGANKKRQDSNLVALYESCLYTTLCRQARHGSPENGENERHAGDLGNITAGPDGRATFRIVDSIVKAGSLTYFLTLLKGYFADCCLSVGR